MLHEQDQFGGMLLQPPIERTNQIDSYLNLRLLVVNY